MNTHPAAQHQTHLRIPGPTQLALLDTLQRAPFLRVEDLALELGVSESQSAAHLRILEAGQYVAHVSRPTPIRPTTGNPVRLYLLTRTGLAILLKIQTEPDTRIPWWGTQDRRLLALLPRLDRLLIGHAFLHSLLVSAPRLLSERGRAARVRWTWIRDYQQTLPALPQQALAESRRLFADFLLVLQVRQQGVSDEQYYPLFLLLDHTCLPMRQIRTRLLACVQARTLAARLHAQTGERFPLVVILLPAWHRARHWQRLAAELARNGVDPLRGCLTVLPDTPFDGWRLPWQALHRYGLCENPRASLSLSASGLSRFVARSLPSRSGDVRRDPDGEQHWGAGEEPESRIEIPDETSGPPTRVPTGKRNVCFRLSGPRGFASRTRPLPPAGTFMCCAFADAG